MVYIPQKESRIKKSLMDQLTQKGLDGEFYKNLIEDYIYFYRMKDRLQKEIDNDGAIIRYQNSYGSMVTKKNDACDMLLKTNAQMLKILDFLKIKPDENIDMSDDDDEL